MTMSNLPAPSDGKPSFWDTKDGTWGIIVGVLLLAGIGYGLLHLLPMINTLLALTVGTIWHLITIIGLGAVLFGLIYVLILDDGLRNLLVMRYQLLIKAARRAVIDQNPIGVLRHYQDQARERRKVVQKNREAVSQEKRNTAEVLDSLRKDFEMLEKEKRSIEGKPDKAYLLQSTLSKIGKTVEVSKQVNDQLEKITRFHNKLTEAYKALETMDADIDFDIKLLERQHKAANSLATAWGNIRSALKGDAEFDLMKDEAIASIQENYGKKMGLVDIWIEDCQTVVDKVNAKEEMYAADAIHLLDKLNSSSFDQLIAKQAPQTAISYQPVQDVRKVGEAQFSGYSDMMKK